MRKKPIVFPADVYDTLEMVGEAYGGFFPERLFDASGRPACPIGGAIFAGIIPSQYNTATWLPPFYYAISLFRTTYHISADQFDAAIYSIRRRAPKHRVSWAEIAQELNIQRGS